MQFRKKVTDDGAAVLSGEVCMVRIVVRSSSESDSPSSPIELLDKAEVYLRREMEAAVARTLGPDFHVASMTAGRGSVELLVIVATSYYAISRYKNFVESINLMVEQLRRVAADYFARSPRGPADVTATWSPAVALMNTAPLAGSFASSVGLLTWYLVLSHATMLVALLWLLLKYSL